MKKHYKELGDELITLIPLTADHIQEMRKLSNDPEIWIWYTEDLTHPDALEKWMAKRLAESKLGDKMSYAVKLNKTGEIIGSSSYGHID